MAYTIISQNNSTTTLSDGVNTITVPSRVNLTSGNFTIVEVNNNMATLEDGDGNVYRDIPCVATLAGEGGGGSGLPDQTGHSGEFLTTDGTDASWAAVDALPSQTGHSGEFLTTDGTDASWAAVNALQNTATGFRSIGVETSSIVTYTNCTIIGYAASTTGNYSTAFGDASKAANGGVSMGSIAISSGQFSTAVGYTARATKEYSVSFGCGAETTAVGAIQVGYGTNNEVGTLYVGLVKSASPWDQTNYKLLDSDGTIPTARLTKVNSTITLTSAGWSGGSQTVTVTGMTTTGVVLVSPDPTDQSAYTSAGILCTAQAADSLTFTCSTTPTGDLDVVVVML